MKLNRILIIAMLLCFLFPAFSNADQYDDAINAMADKDYEKAYKLLEPLVEQNNLRAQTLLGTMYFKGQGVERDYNKGLAMIMDAAKKGNESAEVIAAALCKEIAELGDVKAMHNMGYMCLKGWGGAENDPYECVKWLEMAAENGNKNSAKVLSDIYKKGSYGITPDKEKASYFKKMAQN